MTLIEIIVIAAFVAAIIWGAHWIGSLLGISALLAAPISIVLGIALWWLIARLGVPPSKDRSTRKVSLSEFQDLVQETIAPVLTGYGFALSFAEYGRTYAAHFVRDDMAIVISRDFQTPHLECDVVRLPPGDEPAIDRLSSRFAIQNWTELQQLIDASRTRNIPPKIGLFPTADDYRRGLLEWREVLKDEAKDLLTVRNATN